MVESTRVPELAGLLEHVLQDPRKESKLFEMLVPNNIWDMLHIHFANKIKI